MDLLTFKSTPLIFLQECVQASQKERNGVKRVTQKTAVKFVLHDLYSTRSTTNFNLKLIRKEFGTNYLNKHKG